MKLRNLLLSLSLILPMQALFAQTFFLSPYEDIEEGGDFSDYAYYEGNVSECAPVNFGYEQSGSQILLSKSLFSQKPMCIKSLSFKWFAQGAYGVTGMHFKVYLSETNAADYPTKKKRSQALYRFFDLNRAQLVYDDDVDFDVLSYDYMIGDEKVLKFNTPFFFSGQNNLVVTIVGELFENSEVTAGLDNLNFFMASVPNSGKALPYVAVNVPFDVRITEGDIWSDQYGPKLIDLPVCKFDFLQQELPGKEWMSFVPEDNMDFTGLEGFEAYKVVKTGACSIKIERVESAEAGTPLIATTNIHPSIAYKESVDTHSDNLLQESDGTVKGDGSTVYALTKKNGKVGFALVGNGVTIPKGKVCFQLEADGVNFFPFEDDVNGIANLPAETVQPAQGWYTISGQRVSQPTKGLYIYNGKKVVK